MKPEIAVPNTTPTSQPHSWKTNCRNWNRNILLAWQQGQEKTTEDGQEAQDWKGKAGAPLYKVQWEKRVFGNNRRVFRISLARTAERQLQDQRTGVLGIVGKQEERKSVKGGIVHFRRYDNENN